MTSSIYAAFAMDEGAERNGIWVDYGKFRVLLASSGAGNKKFAAAYAREMKPYRRQIQTGTMDEKVAERILLKLFVENIIRGWQVADGVSDEGSTKWADGIHDPASGEVIGFTPENVKKVLTAEKIGRALFADLRAQSSDDALYREVVLEADAGN